MPLFTIFTGTYNSADVIHRVFKSLEMQTCRDFEWVVIDDCSSDNTIQLVESFITSHPEIPATLIRHQTNTGVGVSRREALEKATGNYFITWDHDDEQSPEQLAVFKDIWQKHPGEKIGSINAKTQDQYGKLLGKLFPENNWVSDYITVHNDYLTGSLEKGAVVEHHVCSKTALFLKTMRYFEKHPELLGQNFPSGGDIWAMMAYWGYTTVYTNTVVRTYYVAETGRSSMSSGGRKKKSDRIYYHKLLWVNYFNSRMPDGYLVWKLRMLFGAIMYGFLSGRSFFNMLSDIKSPGYKMLSILLVLPAYFKSRQFAGN